MLILNRTKIFALLCFIFQFVIFIADAQTQVTDTLRTTQPAGEYYSYRNIILSPGFSFTAQPNQSLHLYIAGNAPDCQVMNVQASNSKNYVVTYTARSAGINNLSDQSLTSCQVNANIQYYDGLGRPVQTVQVRGATTGYDIIQTKSYDDFNREVSQGSPYSVATGVPGTYRTNSVNERADFYNTGGQGYATTSFPYSQTVYENSPLNRQLQQGAPGAAWQPNGTTGATDAGHTVKTDYYLNNNTYPAQNYAVSALYTFDGHYLFKNKLTYIGAFAKGQLNVTVTRDENWSAGNAKLNTIESYTNKNGQLVVRRTYNHNSSTNQDETLSTYYVYDDFGNLCYVLPPGASPDNGSISQQLLDNYCYQYRYDGRGRMIEKKIPGQGWQLIVYNQADQPVATQDSMQRMKSTPEWSFVKYDVLGRVLLTGIYKDNGKSPGVNNRVNLQNTLDAATVIWETRPENSSYSNNAWPTTTGLTVLSVNYYDNYNIPGKPAYTVPSNSYSISKLLPTASQTTVLNANGSYGAQLWAVNYFDAWGKNITAYKQHYLNATASSGNYDRDSTAYNDVTGEVLGSYRRHYTMANGTAPALTVVNSYTYDHVGRKTKTTEQINNNPAVTLSQLDYNDIGQLKTKHLGNDIQQVAYTYNERGWLLTSQSNSSLLNLDLRYNNADAGTQQYNGNISQMSYTTTKVANPGPRTFTYTYDNLNRLTNAAFTGGTSSDALNEQVSYDVMGNISQLTRGGQAYSALSYSYENSNQSNHLSSVTGSGFTSRSYTYDANGNANSDGQGKGISYNLLNLPQTVTQGTTVLATYTYDASGEKLRNTGSDGSWDYIKGIVYQNNALSFIQTDEGRIAYNSGAYTYEYNLQDHLGNNRVSFDNNGGVARVVQEDEYYSFGLRKRLGAYDLSNNNRYLYNGKEIQTDLVNQYDYGARFYDPVIGRFGTIDPLAEKDRRWSSYSYGHNNPITHIDVDGMFDWVKDQEGNISWDKNAHSQATTKAGETYLGKTLSFNFNSYIDGKKWDGPTLFGLVNPAGNKLTSNITLQSTQNENGELTGISATRSVTVGNTPLGLARDSYPGEGGSNNVFSFNSSKADNGTLSSFNLNFEQHASVSKSEEFLLNGIGLQIVDVAQKLNINYNGSNGNLSVSAYTDIFPSATLKANGSTIMQYNQPSFISTHTAPIVGSSSPTLGSLPIHDFSYYPSRFFKRN